MRARRSAGDRPGPRGVETSASFCAGRRHAGDAGSDGAPHEPVDIQFIRRLQEIEREAGAAPGIAREIALSILTARDEALQAGERIEPPAMSHEAFLTLIGRLRRRLRQAASATTQEAA